VILDGLDDAARARPACLPKGGSTVPSERSRLAALLLCFFLGYLGIHRFYVGKWVTGIIWLLTGGLVGLGLLYDFIVIAIGIFRDADGQRLERW